MLNGELYTQSLQTLIYLHLFTDCFMKISEIFAYSVCVYIFNIMKFKYLNKYRWYSAASGRCTDGAYCFHLTLCII